MIAAIDGEDDALDAYGVLGGIVVNNFSQRSPNERSMPSVNEVNEKKVLCCF